MENTKEIIRLNKKLGGFYKERIDYWMLTFERQLRQGQLNGIELECAIDADHFLLEDLKRRRNELLQQGITEEELECPPFCGSRKG